ncbi:MAG: DUF3231 family protein [Sporomusaceae bacterium]|nr:DUF3231 family protein [Sporomusaceae bacterium]
MNTAAHNIRLTAAEVGSLWIHFMNGSLSKCTLSYFRARTKDTEIQPVLDTALSMLNSQLNTITKILQQEEYPLPVGFTDKDVMMETPRLFSDPFHLNYVRNLAKTNMVAHALSVSMTTRADKRALSMQSLKDAGDLDEQATKVMQSKGLAVRPPYITPRGHAEYIQSTDFLGSFFGQQRMLSSLEITHLFLNAQSNAVAKALFIGFSQVAHDEVLRDLFVRAADIVDKHVEIFNTTLKESGVPGPMSLDSDITVSTTPPFSDKLMLYHLVALMNMALGYYASAMGASLRADLMLDYTRLTVEIEKINWEAISLLIDRGWAEQPPMAPDRKKLAYSGKSSL